MERLTKRAVSASGFYKVCCVNFRNHECEELQGECLTCSTNKRAWERLAEYEDINLMPDELKQALRKTREEAI